MTDHLHDEAMSIFVGETGGFGESDDKRVIGKIHKLYAAELTRLQAEALQWKSDAAEAAIALRDRSAALKEAIRLMTQYAQEAGEAKGRLEMSEAAGIVDGWREKCEALEAECVRLRGEVEHLTLIVGFRDRLLEQITSALGGPSPACGLQGHRRGDGGPGGPCGYRPHAQASRLRERLIGD